MKHSILLIVATCVLCFANVRADEAMELTTFGWGRSQETFSEAPNFIALHRWLLEQGFNPCKPIRFESIQEPVAKPNEETFWYVGSYNGSPDIHVYLKFGTAPNSLGVYVQINVASRVELEALKKKLQPLIEESKHRVEPIVTNH